MILLCDRVLHELDIRQLDLRINRRGRMEAGNWLYSVSCNTAVTTGAYWLAARTLRQHGSGCAPMKRAGMGNRQIADIVPVQIREYQR